MKNSISLTTAAIVMCFSCTISNGFSPQEKSIITDLSKGPVMYVLQTDNSEDSLKLRQVSDKVTAEMIHTEEFTVLIERMLATVNDSINQGVGIAAPQVGILRNIIVVQRFDKAGEPFEAYVNPEITGYDEEKVTGPEGCLSIPDTRADVERSSSITIKYNDSKNFREKTEKVEGFTSVIFQHEVDHLNGILFIDRL